MATKTTRAALDMAKDVFTTIRELPGENGQIRVTEVLKAVGVSEEDMPAVEAVYRKLYSHNTGWLLGGGGARELTVGTLAIGIALVKRGAC